MVEILFWLAILCLPVSIILLAKIVFNLKKIKKPKDLEPGLENDLKAEFLSKSLKTEYWIYAFILSLLTVFVLYEIGKHSVDSLGETNCMVCSDPDSLQDTVKSAQRDSSKYCIGFIRYGYIDDSELEKGLSPRIIIVLTDNMESLSSHQIVLDELYNAAIQIPLQKESKLYAPDLIRAISSLDKRYYKFSKDDR